MAAWAGRRVGDGEVWIRWRIMLTFLRKVVEVRVALRALVNFAVVLGFALERRRK